MTERDWTDGKPWGTESYTETCEACGTVNEITVRVGPPGGDERFSVECAKCSAKLDDVKAFGHPTVVQKGKN